MKIEIIKTKQVYMENIEIGQCFIKENQLYMKVGKGELKHERRYFKYIAVNLKNNELYVFHGEVVVKPINAKIVIEDYKSSKIN